MRSVELFSGCGGLALGLARAGFKHDLLVEVDSHASSTLFDNKRRGVRHIAEWPIQHIDIRDVNFAQVSSPVDLVAGGPPCQPFSVGGKHVGPGDERNLWPEAIRAVRLLRPKAFLFENVRGLLRPAFAEYLSYLELHLAWPEIVIRPNEAWSSHFTRLKRHATTRKGTQTYRVIFRAINTADYGAPQKRLRTMVMGIRTDIATDWDFPPPTHSLEALAWTQYVSNTYWAKHHLRCRDGYGHENRVLLKRIQVQDAAPLELPWLTVRDAISDLPSPMPGKATLPNHNFRGGARIYARHTGSRWDEPAKALKAGDHGVPGGENMLVNDDGSVRYFTLREMARLQGFPDDFVLMDAWKQPIKQLGNAVPVHVGELFGKAVIRVIGQTAASSTRTAETVRVGQRTRSEHLVCET